MVIWVAGLGGGTGGIGKRRFGHQGWRDLAAAPYGARQRSTAGGAQWRSYGGDGAVVARGACVSGKGKGARDVLRRVGRKVASRFLDQKKCLAPAHSTILAHGLPPTARTPSPTLGQWFR